MSKKVNAGIVTAYGAAVRGGYEGTYAQFCADLGKLADVLSEFLGFSVSVETLAEGEQATASYDGGILSLGIPRGSTGNGIQSIVLNADYTLTVTYTNGNHWTSGSIRGQVGATPHLTIGTVQTLEPGQSATAEITGTDEDPVLNLGIPKGQAGASDAGGVSYDPEGSYNEGTVGAELQEQNRQLNDKQDAPSTAGTAGQVLGLDSNLNPAWMDQTGGGGGMNIVNLSGTQITQVGADNTMYMCGELTELTFTAPSVGITGIRFTSGTTPTVLTISGVTAWMFDFDPTTLEADTTYEINILNGIGVAGWT